MVTRRAGPATVQRQRIQQWVAHGDAMAKNTDLAGSPKRFEVCAEALFRGYAVRECRELIVKGTGLRADDPVWPWSSWK